MYTPMYCPQCSAPLEIDETKEYITCSYCGAKLKKTQPENQTINYNTNNYTNNYIRYNYHNNKNKPNLFISFSSTSEKVGMVVRVVDTNDKRYYISGQRMSYKLFRGEHIIVLKIGKKNYNRRVFIIDGSKPVRIYASWNGRAHISIDQPPYYPDYHKTNSNNQKLTNNPNGSNNFNSLNYSQTNTAPVYNTSKQKRKTWYSILGFVCSLTFVLCFPAFILCLIDLIINEKDKSYGLSIAGIVISGITIIALVLSWLS